MSALYFVCGGPLTGDDTLDILFPGALPLPDSQTAFYEGWPERNTVALGLIETNGYWVVGGNPNWIFENGRRLAQLLSINGKAGEFYRESYSMYSEVVLYENGEETKRYYHCPDHPNARPNSIDIQFDADGLWTESEKILPSRWENILRLPTRWFRVNA